MGDPRGSVDVPVNIKTLAISDVRYRQSHVKGPGTLDK